ncbi:zinc finger protein 746 isoform X2 [Pteropus medius]|uniref:zinc finger protein 746 isoform X2 n=1 Tax=Pteropus vampyrus TaxID=132908 RepID=UPI00196A5BD5|nr:zinc finger protein 746 isoform X2 [Pteropus giganteus]
MMGDFSVDNGSYDSGHGEEDRIAGCPLAFPRRSNWHGREEAGRLREDDPGVREPAGGQVGRAGDAAAGVRAAAEAAGEHGEPAEEQELLGPAAAPGQQGGGPQGVGQAGRVAEGALQARDEGQLRDAGLPGLRHLQARGPLPDRASKGAVQLAPRRPEGSRRSRRPESRLVCCLTSVRSISLAGRVSAPGLRVPDAVCSHILPFLGSGPPVPAPDLLMQIKQEGELQLQEQQALGVEAWAAGQPDIGEEPWGLSQLDSGAGDVSTDATSGVHTNFSTTIPPTSWQADLPPHHPSSACSDGTLKLNTAASTEDVKIVIKTEVQEEEVVATPVHPTDLEAHGPLFGPGQATRFFPSPVQEGAWDSQGGSFPSQDPVLGLREPARPERDMAEPSPAVAQDETPPGDWLFGGVRWGWNFRCKPPVGLNPRTGPEGLPFPSPDNGEAVLDPGQAPRPFSDPCKYPGRTKGFGHKPGLKKHPAAPPGGRPFTCATCGKSFQLQVSLSAHQRSCGLPEGAPGAAGTARDGSALRCGECGRCFTRPAHLIRHRMLHTGERPFPCTECEKRFTERSKLIDHYRTHTGVRPFTCTVCGKSFIRKDHLRKHQRNHAAGAKGAARGQPLPPLPAGPPDPFKSPASKGPLASTDLVTDWTCGLSVLGPADGGDL